MEPQRSLEQEVNLLKRACDKSLNEESNGIPNEIVQIRYNCSPVSGQVVSNQMNRTRIGAKCYYGYCSTQLTNKPNSIDRKYTNSVSYCCLIVKKLLAVSSQLKCFIAKVFDCIMMAILSVLLLVLSIMIVNSTRKLYNIYYKLSNHYLISSSNDSVETVIVSNVCDSSPMGTTTTEKLMEKSSGIQSKQLLYNKFNMMVLKNFRICMVMVILLSIDSSMARPNLTNGQVAVSLATDEVIEVGHMVRMERDIVTEKMKSSATEYTTIVTNIEPQNIISRDGWAAERLAHPPTESFVSERRLPTVPGNKFIQVIDDGGDDSIREALINDVNAIGVPESQDFKVFTIDWSHVQTPFIIGIWILSASVAKIGFHKTPKLNTIFPESCLLIVIGVVIGVILLLGGHFDISPLTPDTFFYYMLPPIILDAGYFMPNRLFFDHLGTILLMAVVGTIFNVLTIGSSLWACGCLGIYGANVTTPLLHIFLFSSLISAVDPVAVLAVFEEIHVNEILYIVVFGESLLNDAVTVVIYHMCEAYNRIGIRNIGMSHLASGVASFAVVALGGTIIGVIWGFLTGLVTRYTDNVRVIEPIFIFVMAYLAYLNAELFHMSGILAITFCGITMKNYVEANISQKSHTTIKYALKMMSSSSETIIFMFLGVATVNNRHDWNTWFIILTIVFCTIYRILGVVLLTWMANKFRVHTLSAVDQFVMSYGGLRGAVAFALVLLIDKDMVPLQPMFVTTTITVIYFTVFLQGITIKPLVKFLNVKRANKKKPTMNERIHERFMDHLMAGIEDIAGKTGNHNVRDKFKRFDNKFIRPALIRDLQGAEPKILETYSKLTMKDAIDFMRRNPSTIGQMSGTESMSALFRNYTGGVLGGSPSLSNFENCSRNLDMHELDYNPSKKDLTDARIHHLLAEELKPYKRHRRLSYSRHAVDDSDLTTQQVNYKMHMNIRRMNDRKHHKRSKRGSSKEGVRNHVSFPEFKQNGSAKQLSHGTKLHQSYRNIIRKHSHSLNKYRRLELDYINEVLNEQNDDDDKKISGNKQQNEEWDGLVSDGLTFTAKLSPDSDRANNNSLIAHITNLPGFDASKARFVKQYCSSSPKSDKSAMEIVPTAAELMLPWRRDRSYLSFGNDVSDECQPSVEDEIIEKRLSRESEGESRVTTPTAIESQLPWKRDDDDDEDGGGLQQNEFPAWASNKEYLAYNSPSATFLGGLTKPRPVKSVIGLFRRESSTSATGEPISAGSDPQLARQLSLEMMLPPSVPSSAGHSTVHSPRTSIGRPARHRSASVCCSVTPIVESHENGSIDPLGALKYGDSASHHTSPFQVMATHRRTIRRGSLLELNGDSIPEEHQSNQSKSLPYDDELNRREPCTSATLLPKLSGSGTPKPNIRRMNNTLPQSSLISINSSDEEDEEDYEDYPLIDIDGDNMVAVNNIEIVSKELKDDPSQYRKRRNT